MIFRCCSIKSLIFLSSHLVGWVYCLFFCHQNSRNKTSNNSVPPSVDVTSPYDLQQRHRSDNQVNNRKSFVIRDGRVVEERWQKVVVGDIIKMENDQFVAVSGSRPFRNTTFALVTWSENRVPKRFANDRLFPCWSESKTQNLQVLCFVSRLTCSFCPQVNQTACATLKLQNLMGKLSHKMKISHFFSPCDLSFPISYKGSSWYVHSTRG